jgi:hypothetical protein
MCGRFIEDPSSGCARSFRTSMVSIHSSPGEPRAMRARRGSDFGTRSQLGSDASSGRARESRYPGIAMGDATGEGREARVSMESIHSSPGEPRAKGSRRGPATGFSRANSSRDAGAGASLDARIRTSGSELSLCDDQRAVRLADAMSRGAMIFDSAVQATPAHFARSRPVLMYNFFVSHSWSASRWDKFAGLLYR